jgi:cell wall assembly regulator SMI1
MTLSYRDQFIALVRLHVARDPRRADGCSEAAIAKAERRLGARLPEALRTYYLVAGRLDELNSAHNLLYGLGQLEIQDRRVIFMEENQAVVHWGFAVKSLADADPIVYQRANVSGAKWYSERARFSVFISKMFAWQAGIADAPL